MQVSPQAFPLLQILQQYCCRECEPKGEVWDFRRKSFDAGGCVSARAIGDRKLMATRIAIIVFIVRTLAVGT